MSDESKKDGPQDGLTRRGFVAGVAKAGVALSVAPMIVPRHVLGGPGYTPPSRTLNFASVGIGGMGMNNAAELVKGGENLVAVCDVDFPYVERSLAGRMRPPQGQTSPTPEAVKFRDAYTAAAKYEDYRVMLERQRDIDAVVIATPDHMHAAIAYAAMKAGKHVYVQKPLTWSVYEARLLARTAQEMKVATQMGNQGHSGEGTFRVKELLDSGIIGKVHEVHVWTDRPQRYWPQGIPRPRVDAPAAATGPGGTTATAPAPGASQPGTPPSPPAPPRWSVRTVDNAILRAMADNPTSVPPGLNWDLYLGVAKPVPYHPVYHPFSWRGWPEFGVSALGDMGAHLIDQSYFALDLGLPTSIVSTSTPWGGTAQAPGSYPLSMMTRYKFPARGRNKPAVTLYWYDGGLYPFLPNGIPYPGGDGGGAAIIGEKGVLTHETYGNNPKLYPDSLTAKAAKVAKKLPRITTSHEMNWSLAAKGEGTASSPFDYAARLTEVMLLGVVALRAGNGKEILYDGANMKITNVPDANQYLTREYRQGWGL
jgi:predicted dehydrogenase